jgi:hypothetical protein
MKTLPEIARDAAVAGVPFGRAPLELEHRITQVHREHEGLAPADRELAVLRAQFPAVLRPLEQGDLFAGRILYPLVSFSPEPGGLAYSCREDVIREVIAAHGLTGAALDRAEEMLSYWRHRATSFG